MKVYLVVVGTHYDSCWNEAAYDTKEKAIQYLIDHGWKEGPNWWTGGWSNYPTRADYAYIDVMDIQ